jgi:hypothetical protein
MPVVFSNPALLLGALAGAVPVIIHFLSLRKVRRQQFSDLRFLTEVQARQARSLGVRRWILLLLRVLAILLIVLAVSGPHWGGLVAGSGGSTSLLFVLDTSASMNTQGENGTRLDEALNACRSMMESVPDRTTIQVIASGSRTRTLFGDWIPAGAGAVRGLSLVQPSDGAFDPVAVARLASREVARAPSAQVQMIWISDLQVHEFSELLESALADMEGIGRLQHLVRPVGEFTPGGGVLAVDLPRRAVHQGENVNISALVITQHDEEAFVLELDGRPVAETVVTESTSEPRRILFPVAVPGPGLHRGTVRKATDQFAGDDQRPFVLEVPSSLEVLIVHGRDRSVDGPGGRGGWRYLAQALAPGGEPELLRVRSVESTSLTTGDLAASQVVFFVDPDPLGRRVLEGTASWLKTGGAACFLLGEPVQGSYYANTLLPALGLSGELEDSAATASSGQEQRPRIIDPGHPVFAGLGEDALGTVGDVIWQRWFRLGGDELGVLVELTDSSPLVATADLEDGKLVIMPWHLSPASNGLVTSPMALPFFQRLTLWLGGRAGLAAGVNQEVGQQARVFPVAHQGDERLERSEDLGIRTEGPDDGTLAELVWKNGKPVLVGPVVDRAGFTVFLAANDTVGLVAAAVPRGESETRLYTTGQWEEAMARRGLVLAATMTPEAGDDLAGLLSGRPLAPWLFLLAFLVLLIESYVGRGATSRNAISG